MDALMQREIDDALSDRDPFVEHYLREWWHDDTDLKDPAQQADACYPPVQQSQRTPPIVGLYFTLHIRPRGGGLGVEGVILYGSSNQRL